MKIVIALDKQRKQSIQERKKYSTYNKHGNVLPFETFIIMYMYVCQLEENKQGI